MLPLSRTIRETELYHPGNARDKFSLYVGGRRRQGRSVGTGGLVLHGGYDISTRTQGLALDWLIRATVVLSNGTIYLFWALPRAGSSFGIVAEFEFDTFEAPSQVTTNSLAMNWLQSEAVDGFRTLQDLIIEAPKELNMVFLMAPAGQATEGAFYGEADGLRREPQLLLTYVKTQETQAGGLKSKTTGWFESLKAFVYGTPLGSTFPLRQHANMYATNVMTYALKQEQIEALMSIPYDNINSNEATHT
ncbi:hypothetical protein EDB80DRAFT_880590 [Ilyonectria destructans]|nr:hypothetical protein EDB80DRAFT_880590 [Ilyonectria destructans]